MRAAIAWVSALLLGAAACTRGAPPAQPPPSSPPVLTPAEVAARSTPAIVSIRGPDSLGTGFLVRPEGWIATNLHVIAGASVLVVVLPDKSEHRVTDVVAIDEDRDLAIVKIDTTKQPVLALGDSGRVRPGDPVVAIGHPLGLEDTVSNGLVSAVRKVDDHLTILQISAPIAPGSSGGPLFNDRGEVIGVAAAIITEGQNLNFGVPVAYVKELLEKPKPVSFEEFAKTHAPREEEPAARPRATMPHHPIAILQGCQDADFEVLGHTIEGAISVGAPLYNQGNFAACYHIYEGASLDAERKLGAACVGPRRALGEGRKRAAALHTPEEQAWAMRDAFDGVLDVIVRKLESDKR